MVGAAFARRRLRLPLINTEFEINVNAKPKGYRRPVENRPQYGWKAHYDARSFAGVLDGDNVWMLSMAGL